MVFAEKTKNKEKVHVDARDRDFECMSNSLQAQQSSQQASPKSTWLAFQELPSC